NTERRWSQAVGMDGVLLRPGREKRGRGVPFGRLAGQPELEVSCLKPARRRLLQAAEEESIDSYAFPLLGLDLPSGSDGCTGGGLLRPRPCVREHRGTQRN